MKRSAIHRQGGPAAAILLWLCMLATPARPEAAKLVAGEEQAPWSAHISEAARRFGLPEPWIRSVIRAESGGDPRAVSPKGAMGLMQIMPETWAELRDRYGLGRDPYDPRDNIIAGAAYLREMHDRYGFPGLFAAYNAGPRRVDDYLSHGRPLPAETLAYLRALRVQSVPGRQRTRAMTGTDLFVDLRGEARTTAPRRSPDQRLFVPMSSLPADGP